MSMTREKIIDAQAEASRFIRSANDALSRLNAENDERNQWYEERHNAGIDEPHPPTEPQPHDYSYGSKQTGALRRASLDLTRTLAELRK